jgi:hypothetical protein
MRLPFTHVGRQTGTIVEFEEVKIHTLFENMTVTAPRNVCYALTSDFLIGPFIFAEGTATASTQLDIMQCLRYHKDTSSSKEEPLYVTPM